MKIKAAIKAKETFFGELKLGAFFKRPYGRGNTIYLKMVDGENDVTSLNMESFHTEWLDYHCPVIPLTQTNEIELEEIAK
jgi:hypothetical protein